MTCLFEARRFAVDYDNKHNLSTIVSDYVENFLLENELKFSDVDIDVSVRTYGDVFKIVEASLTIKNIKENEDGKR